MRKYFQVIILAIVMTFSVGPVLAQTEAEVTREEQVEARATRLAELKEQQQLRLEATKLAILESRCERAQDKVVAALSKVTAAQSRRTAVYENMIEKLEVFLVRFENEGYDVTELEAQIATLKTMISEVEADFANHLLYLSDLAEMDCASDPEGFYAALTAARDELRALRASTKALHQYFMDEIRPAFVTAIQAIYGEEETAGEDSEETTEETTTDEEA